MTDHDAIIAAETARFAEALHAVDAAASVPTCPDWTAGDLAWHLTEVHAFWAGVLRSGATTDAEVEAVEAAKPPRPADRAATLALLETETAALLAELAARPDEQPAWFWLETDQTVGATRRMQAYEATMHRVDAELTAGLDPTRISTEVALGAIRHAFDVMWAWWGTLPGFTFTPVGGVVELATTDAEESWSVEAGRWQGVGESGKSYDEPGARLTTAVEAGEPAASVSGTAEQIALWLWGRGPEPTASGDEETLAALRAAQSCGMQ